MVRVKLGGRELRIEDSAVAEFLKKGYSVIDDNGNVIQEGHVTNYNQAIERNKALVEENAALKEQCANLSDEFAQAMAANESCAALINSLETANASLAEENAALKAELDELKKAAAKAKSK